MYCSTIPHKEYSSFFLPHKQVCCILPGHWAKIPTAKQKQDYSTSMIMVLFTFSM
jgi:hypothetical protein